MDKKYNSLPEEVLSTGHSLETVGIAEIAWKSQEALKVVEFLISKGYPILGGDVYAYDEKSLETTYDSWYVDKMDTEEFVNESRKKALEYIVEYNKINGDDYLYSIIFEIV